MVLLIVVPWKLIPVFLKYSIPSLVGTSLSISFTFLLKATNESEPTSSTIFFVPARALDNTAIVRDKEWNELREDQLNGFSSALGMYD